MATTTPNFGWAVPTSTDLVKDGAVAIETLGDSIDASLVDLKGGTTDQVLAKNSNTDMDFKWVSDATGMTNPMTTTGDVIYSSSGSTPARLGIGTAGQVLKVNSGATAPEWETASSGALTKITSAAFSAVASVSLPTGTFSATYRNYKVVFIISTVSTSQTITGRYRIAGSDQTGAAYYGANTGTRADNAGVVIANNNGGSSFTLGYTLGAYQAVALDLTFFSPNEAVRKQFSGTGVTGDSTFNNYATRILGGEWITASAVDSFSFIADTGTITGSYAVYGLEN
jgi:hypothetical protein